METIGRKFCPHFPDDRCRMIAKNSSVSISQIDTDYQRKTTSVSSPMQNVGANFRQHFPHKSKIQSNLYLTALYIAVTLYTISQSMGSFPKFSVALYFLQSWHKYSGHPVYNGHFPRVTVVHRFDCIARSLRQHFIHWSKMSATVLVIFYLAYRSRMPAKNFFVISISPWCRISVEFSASSLSK